MGFEPIRGALSGELPRFADLGDPSELTKGLEPSQACLRCRDPPLGDVSVGKTLLGILEPCCSDPCKQLAEHSGISAWVVVNGNPQVRIELVIDNVDEGSSCSLSLVVQACNEG